MLDYFDEPAYRCHSCGMGFDEMSEVCRHTRRKQCIVAP